MDCVVEYSQIFFSMHAPMHHTCMYCPSRLSDQLLAALALLAGLLVTAAVGLQPTDLNMLLEVYTEKSSTLSIGMDIIEGDLSRGHTAGILMCLQQPFVITHHCLSMSR